MTRLKQQKGFTLVELAIVITIIGLLIGGILKGQQLMTNARVTATIQQVKAVEAASTTFYDSYGKLPGDMDGTSKVPGCTSSLCQLTGVTVNDGVIGSNAWDLETPQITGVVPSNTVATETYLFWYYLAATNMISGIDGSTPITTTGTPVFGKNYPATRFGGGFLVGYSNGATLGARASGAVTITGTILSTVISPTAAVAKNVSGGMLLLPAVAAQMDRKMDDGQPGAGTVQGFGNVGCTGTTGATGAAVVANSIYTEAGKAKDCGLYIQING